MENANKKTSGKLKQVDKEITKVFFLNFCFKCKCYHHHYTKVQTDAFIVLKTLWKIESLKCHLLTTEINWKSDHTTAPENLDHKFIANTQHTKWISNPPPRKQDIAHTITLEKKLLYQEHKPRYYLYIKTNACIAFSMFTLNALHTTIIRSLRNFGE